MKSRPFSEFAYPLNADLHEIVERSMHNERTGHDPVNRNRYPFVINNDRKCKGPDGEDEDIFMVLLIKSQLRNFDQRRIIRKTWAREWLIPYVKIRRLFLLGTSSADDRKTQQRIGLEAQEFDDILQQYFEDSVGNNTFKVSMGLQWVSNYCRSARYVAVLEDDCFVNTHSVVALLQKTKPTDAFDHIYGFIHQNSAPERHEVSFTHPPTRAHPPTHSRPFPGCPPLSPNLSN